MVTRYRPDGSVDRQIDNEVDGVFTATEPITDRITLFEYDALSRVATTTLNDDPPTLGMRTDTNRSSVTAYDPAIGRVIGQRDPLGRWVSQQYDLLGRVATTIQNCTGGSAPAGCGSPMADANVPMTMHYDALGRAFETVDALAHVMHTRYDGLGQSVATLQNYVALGTPTTAITNVTTLTQYDGLGRTTVVTDALGYTTRSGYNDLSQTTLMTDTMNRVTRMGYDGSGMARWTKQPNGQVLVQLVDGLGRVVTTISNYASGPAAPSVATDRDLITRTVYDAAGRRIRQSQRATPADQVTQFAYDLQDRLAAVTEHVVSGACTVPPCNIVTQYRYDRAGNRIAIVDARNNVRSFSYDAADQQIGADDPVHPPTAWIYDAGGRLATQNDPRGSAYDLSYSYDELDRLSNTAAGNPTVAQLPTITASYDALGRRVSLADGAANTRFSYDALSRMSTAVVTPTGQTAYTIGYSYTRRGERSQVSYPNSGPSVQYGYWPDGQLHLVTDTTTLASYAYDTVGRLRQVVRANGAVTNYNYDQAERLIDSTSSVSGTVVGRFQYAYNHLGLRTVVTETMALTPTLSQSWMETGSFEAGSLTDPTSGVDQVFGTVEVETVAPIKGAFSARVPNTGDSFMRENIADTDNLFVSFYLRVTAAPGSNTRVFQISNRTGPSSFVTVANMQLTTNRRLRLRNDSTTIGLDSAQLTLGTVYRVGVWQKKGTGSNALLAGYLATGDAPFTSPFASSEAETFTTPAARVNLGASTSTAANIVVDDFRLDRGLNAPPALAFAARAEVASASQAGTSTPASATPAAEPFPPAPDASSASAAFGRLPLAFVPNAGQTDARARFMLRGGGGTMFFGVGDLILALRPPTRPRQQAPPRERKPPRKNIPSAVLQQGYQGTNPAATLTGELRLPGRTNFLTGSDPAKWRTDLPTYAGMLYSQIYTGIDLHYTGTEGQLKSTYVVAPGADPARIRWRYTGAQQVRVDKDGNLVVTLPAPSSDLTDTEVLTSTLIEHAPVAWQTIKDREVAVPIRYAVAADGTVSFALGAYNRTKALIIDPILSYSTFIGGGGADVGNAITVDSSGNAYLTGTTASTNFPGVTPRLDSSDDAFVVKLNPSGSAILYSTYLGGSGDDAAHSIAVDNSSNVFVAGDTDSSNFPTLHGLSITAPSGTCIFENQTTLCRRAFVAKLNTTGSGMIYSTYLGGSAYEEGRGIAIDSSGNAYVTGATNSTNFPVAHALQATAAGGTCPKSGGGTYPCADAFVTKLLWNGTALSYGYSTYLAVCRREPLSGSSTLCYTTMYETNIQNR